jgi:hypothetical protein
MGARLLTFLATRDRYAPIALQIEAINGRDSAAGERADPCLRAALEHP